MRSVWKGHIRFSMVTIPIRLYNAVDSSGSSIRFNQLHREDNGRIGYDKKCKSCGDALSNKEIVRGNSERFTWRGKMATAWSIWARWAAGSPRRVSSRFSAN